MLIELTKLLEYANELTALVLAVSAIVVLVRGLVIPQGVVRSIIGQTVAQIFELEEERTRERQKHYETELRGILALQEAQIAAVVETSFRAHERLSAAELLELKRFMQEMAFLTPLPSRIKPCPEEEESSS